MYSAISIFAASLILSVCSSAAFAVDLNKVQTELKAQGVVGEVHGANQTNGLYVFTVRGADFFDYVNFSLYATDPKVQKVLSTLKRHDSIRVKGLITNLERPQKHIYARAIEMVKSWDVHLPERQQQVVLPRDLTSKTEFIGRVHAVNAEGTVLVVEYGDAVIPLPVDGAMTELTRKLNRGDKVRVQFIMKSTPQAPTHIALNTAAAKPIEVLDNTRLLHGQPVEVTGALVLFPKSPQVMFDVYALQADLGDGVVREYTLINFENADLFKKLREEAALAWKAAPQSGIYNGRNKLVNPLVQGRAKGILNYIDPNQANPQVVIDQLSDLTFTTTR